MVLFARNDIKSFHNPANGHTHSRPGKQDGTLVPLWGLDCAECERVLHNHPAWAGSRYKIPLTPDEEQAAEDERDLAQRAMQQQQMLLAQQAFTAQMAARGALPEIDPDDIAITSGPDASPSTLGDGPDIDPDVAASDYAVLSKTDLKDLARDRGLSVSGTNRELIERLVKHDREAHP